MKVKCDNCQNYMPCPSGTDDYFYTACKEYTLTVSNVNPLTRDEKQAVMDGNKKSCRGYERM